MKRFFFRLSPGLPFGVLFALSVIKPAGAQIRPAGRPADKRPNIIFILVDDQGYGDLGAFFQNQRARAHDRGKPCEYSPELDRLAAGGAMLTQHYCAAPVCAPSRSSLLLGVSQGHANVRDNQFDKALEDNYTMASTLRQLGYSTAAIGKWGLQGLNAKSPDWPAHPLKRGFGYYFGYIRHGDGHEHYPKEGLYDGAKEVWENYTNIAAGLDKCYTADLWTAAAKKYITGHQAGAEAAKPFFLYLAYETPHAVLELPTGPYPAGGGLRGGIQWTGTPGQMINTAAGKPDTWVHPDYVHATYDDDGDPSTPEVPWPDTYKRYATANRRIDDAVGDLVQLLKDLNIDDNTLIVYTSDNGPSIESYLPKGYVPNHPDFFDSFGPFDGIKRDDWEGGVRVATIARWPGHIPGGKVVTAPSISYDWAPTFLDVAGTPAPARMDGVSLLPALTGKGKQPAEIPYIEYFEGGNTPDFKSFAPERRGRKRNQMQWIRIGDYVGVRYDIKSKDDDFEIYDVVKDPGERHNLAADGAGQEKAAPALQQEMKDKVLQGRRPDSSARRPYDDALVPASDPKTRLSPGLRWAQFPGVFPWLPQTGTLRPAGSGRAAHPDPKSGSRTNGVLYMTGYIRVPQDGEYQFHLASDTKALLRIHEAMVVDAGYGYTPGAERTASIKMKAGLHPFRLYYEQRTTGKPYLSLTWSGPGIERQELSGSLYSGETR
ncbi:MAG: sulfatase-like hydrolase/transferase [Puia sp.]|nr:sulfatase-like hydrolase/transferase [Puia sp.]